MSTILFASSKKAYAEQGCCDAPEYAAGARPTDDAARESRS